MVALVAQDCYEAVIIGLGSRGQKTWFESLRTSSKISVSAVCDSNAAVLDGFASRYPETPAYSSLERLLEQHRPDFAIVCVPNKYHVPVIKHLEAARVPCLKEKPIAGTVEEFLHLCSLKTKIGVTFQRRWQPRYKHFSQLLAEIGRPLSVRATIVGHYDPPKDGWRVRHNVGTFILMSPQDDLGVHMLDVLVWLFGRPSSVFAHCLGDGQPSGRDRESHILMTWEKSGLIGHLYVSEVAIEKDEGLIVRGALGSLHLKGEEIILYDLGGRQTLQMSFQSSKQDVIVSMCQEFGDYISGKEHTYSTSISQVESTFFTTEAINSSFASHAAEKVAQILRNGHQNGHKNGSENGIQTSHRNGYPNSASDTLDKERNRSNTTKSNSHSSEPHAIINGVSAKLSPQVNTAPTVFQLNNGCEMPGLGLGTRKPKRPNETYEAVKKALEVGYRHIDTAFRYNNEDQVGKAVRDSGLLRQAVWVTTKVDNSWHHRVAESVQISLARMGLKYIDLLLMHWPSPVDPDDTKKALPNWDFTMTWQDMQNEVQAGRVRAIGVSNFGIRNLRKLMSHPLCTTIPREYGIHCIAYSPLAFGLPKLHDHSVLADICTRTGKTVQQVLNFFQRIRWGLQRGTSVIPKSVSPERITANFESSAWELTPEDHARLCAIQGRCRVYPDDWLPARVFWEEDD
ncbi:NADP(+) coupled glycerol dehydrogenase [Beauveria bassiana ARSEF 2860]|uniref:NADP(+) coupled glycerol dehydrogenase n=1 Tax=Beauveria bassiana (strain ARSEF 2860) TaxID=655819 RepID=J5JVV9_BEAB2|nr:NADP(+) coupled glycerol dehydrogenase [Beauveria bassiana ARSEF 2860]EJP68778.1 NADP(+) coupled glycerol dehydrogenase [Beauveria bassiana ARSEF 2860]